PAKSGKNAPKLTWKPIIRESSPSQPSQQPETIFENRLFQEQLNNQIRLVTLANSIVNDISYR
ncbi:hypothetical protein, partial [Paenibacillus thermoaerophilus]|uniref:hypothetical protein n=1 Tax=Paenibacillus thermoaerophilus TaxID=1215385 RepID=UPI001B874977